AITITGPSASQYWVQNTSNTISWTATSADPASVDVIVTNTNNQTLNGDFSIARFLNTSSESFVVTNVTLRPGDSYQVVFVNTSNPNQVFANSSDFTVMPPGSAPTVTSPSGASGNSSASASSSASTPSGSSSSASPNAVTSAG
ncbi:hypothetical protein K488DRAFT_37907, partial [Vararia minispora EC-137]